MIAVIFEAQALPEAEERYFQLASELKPLLSDMPGFISMERFQSLNTPGKILSLSWWKDEESVAGWKIIFCIGRRRMKVNRGFFHATEYVSPLFSGMTSQRRSRNTMKAILFRPAE